jgi:hypothetical protein
MIDEERNSPSEKENATDSEVSKNLAAAIAKNLSLEKNGCPILLLNMDL